MHTYIHTNKRGTHFQTIFLLFIQIEVHKRHTKGSHIGLNKALAIKFTRTQHTYGF